MKRAITAADIVVTETQEFPLAELAAQIAAVSDIDSFRTELISMRDMHDNIRKKLFCLGVITKALSFLDETILLFGGTAVEYYTSGGYEGNDIDIFGTNHGKVFGVLRLLGFSGNADHWEFEGFPWPIHYVDDVTLGQDAKMIKIDEKYQVHIIRVENAIVSQLSKIVSGENSNLWYAVARDMLEYHQANIDYEYLHDLADKGGEELKTILRTIEALLNLYVNGVRIYCP